MLRICIYTFFIYLAVLSLVYRVSAVVILNKIQDGVKSCNISSMPVPEIWEILKNRKIFQDTDQKLLIRRISCVRDSLLRSFFDLKFFQPPIFFALFIFWLRIIVLPTPILSANFQLIFYLLFWKGE